MTEWQEFYGKRKSNYAATGPNLAPAPEPAAPVVIGNVTYRPLTRYTIMFEVQPDPRDAKTAELERALKAALAQNGHDSEAQL